MVAIFFAWKQDSDNQTVTRETTNLLTTIRAKIEGMDSKIDKLDPRAVTAPVENQLKEEIEKIINNVGTQVNPEVINEINTKINEKFNSINQELDFYYEPEKPKKMEKYYLEVIVPPGTKEEIIDFIINFRDEFNVSGIYYDLIGNSLTVHFHSMRSIKIKELSSFVSKQGYSFNAYGLSKNK
ncbi:hypothetical protein PVA17_16070 [Lysinibacillus sp. CNPSo 3705]|uniref:hypothetical protein n=1 Tax=Lysinibacillus sp. CNPSo 3705 TaxID=3028148 RepID=UPI002363354B|nr:hypothetical protein [Lysinibacillus sp. CNPSo 3705]MDD1504262.1 hypothetical protein [Lysinibacillus sp. CNPSo 3705]